MSHGSSSQSPSNSPPVDPVDPAMEFRTHGGVRDDDEPPSDSPVPTFFTASQVAELIRSLFVSIGNIVNERPISEALLFQTPAPLTGAAGAATSSPQNATIDVLQLLSVRHAVTLPRLLSHCPLLVEGDFLELQEPTFRAVATLFDSHLVLPLKELRQTLLGKEENVPSTAAGVSDDDIAAVTVPMASSTTPTATVLQVRVKSAKSPPKRAGASAPAVRRNPVTAGVIAKAKESLFRPQSAGIGTPKNAHATSAAPSAAADHSSTAMGVLAGRPSTAGGSLVLTPTVVVPPVLPKPEEQVARTFQEIERQLKDETGHSRFSATEFRVEAEAEDHTNVDRRAKAVQARERDQSLLHSLDSQRREFMIQYFSNPELLERRRRDILQEEMMREARQARAAQIMSCRSPSQSPLGARPASSSGMPHRVDQQLQQQHPRPHGSARDEAPGSGSVEGAAHSSKQGGGIETTEQVSGQSHAHSTLSAAFGAAKKSWAGSQNPLEVWNAVRTRPASAAALLPISHVHAAESVIAKKYLPQPSPSNVPARAASAASSRECTFAEMIARKRDSILAEAKMGLQPGDEAAASTRREGTPSPEKLPASGDDEADGHSGRRGPGWSGEQPSPWRRRGNGGSSSPGGGLIAVIHPDTGLHQRRSDLVQLIEAASIAAIRPSSAADTVSSPTSLSAHGLATTITTAAYLPMSQKAAPSSMLRSPPRSASSGRHSRARARIQDVRDATAEQAPHADLTEFLPQAKRAGNGVVRPKKR